MLRFDVFGRLVLVERQQDRWVAYYSGNEGKRRLATDIVIPSATDRLELPRYLADLCHEWASGSNPDVRQL